MTDSYAQSLLSWATFSAKIGIGLFTVFAGLLYKYQEKILYIPNPPNFPKTPKENPPGYQSPADFSTSGLQINGIGSNSIKFEEHNVITKDNCSIHTWLMLQPNSQDVPTLIYFHGNAGNMGFRLNNAAEMFAIVGINILMMDYRGYGSSTGEPSEEGINMDAEEVLLYAVNHPKLTNSRIMAFGRSLGGAVSIALAHKFPKLVSAVIVENTFLSIDRMVDHLMPRIAPLKGLVLRMHWDSEKKIKELKQPIMYISGDRDTLVPPFHMAKLRELAVNSAHRDFFLIAGGTHNDTWQKGGRQYYLRMKAFVNSWVTMKTVATDVEDETGKCREKSDDVDSALKDVPSDASDTDYYIVSEQEDSPREASSVHIPTMDTNFGVH